MALGFMGRELRRADMPMRSFASGLRLLSTHIEAGTVIDVGVASGTPELYETFRPDRHRYVLVEANPQFAPDLAKLKAKLHATVVSAFCGAQDGQIDLNVYSDPRKSSAHTAVSRPVVERLSVPVKTLDGIVSEFQLPSPYLIKIDVEGAELDVVRGAGGALKETEAVIAEVSFLPRFENETRFADLVRAMDEAGFVIFDLIGGANHPRSGLLMQANAVFVRGDASFRS